MTIITTTNNSNNYHMIINIIIIIKYKQFGKCLFLLVGSKIRGKEITMSKDMKHTATITKLVKYNNYYYNWVQNYFNLLQENCLQTILDLKEISDSCKK